MPDGTTVEGRRTPFGRGIIRNDDYPAGYAAGNDPWNKWGVDPHNPNDESTNYQNGTWMRGWDGDTPTYLTPTGTPWVHSMIGEGPYLKTNDTYGAFTFTVDWRVKDVGQSATPMNVDGTYRMPTNPEHYGNSGVYIYDRYEVQTISTTAPFGQAVPAVGKSSAEQLTPGWAYGVRAPAGQPGPINFSTAPGQWNRMVVEFTPPTLNGLVVVTAAKLKVSFQFLNANGTIASCWVSYGGVGGWNLVDAQGNPLVGTGGTRNKMTPLASGSIYLQGHWGSLVEFKNPDAMKAVRQVEGVQATPATPTNS